MIEPVKNPDELIIEDEDDNEAGSPEAKEHPDAEALIHPSDPPPGTADSTADPTAIDESVDLKAPAVSASNPDEINMDDEDDEEPIGAACGSHENGDLAGGSESATNGEVQSATEGTSQTASRMNEEALATHFLALSKCLPGQDFLQVCQIWNADTGAG